MKEDILKRLVEHLDGDGTINDSYTDKLYREFYGIEEEEETDLEEVENWAVENVQAFHLNKGGY